MKNLTVLKPVPTALKFRVVDKFIQICFKIRINKMYLIFIQYSNSVYVISLISEFWLFSSTFSRGCLRLFLELCREANSVISFPVITENNLGSFVICFAKVFSFLIQNWDRKVKIFSNFMTHNAFLSYSAVQLAVFIFLIYFEASQINLLGIHKHVYFLGK